MLPYQEHQPIFVQKTKDFLDLFPLISSLLTTIMSLQAKENLHKFYADSTGLVP
jgi:hypothetical protein